ncbi:hypothetical protein B9Z55_002868 [Caenorhabditis nigoni]|uniref:Uncharacterized protein n=1 Tax=Caenorhabditis nigoni TaxID=1611254 RepID=A0A2G5VMJ2_9PELO|nr:hypothetical protein B9Z55_002868 [Caenorhabditis nigoni]
MPFLRRFSACSLIESTNFRSFHLPVAGLCEKDDVEEGETTSTADRCEKDILRLLLLSAAGYNEKYVGKRRKRSRLLVDVMNAILRNVGSIIGIQCEVRKSISITNKKEEKRVERKERRKGKKKKESRHDLEFETTKPTTISAKTSVAMMIVKFLLISIFK